MGDALSDLFERLWFESNIEKVWTDLLLRYGPEAILASTSAHHELSSHSAFTPADAPLPTSAGNASRRSSLSGGGPPPRVNSLSPMPQLPPQATPPPPPPPPLQPSSVALQASISAAGDHQYMPPNSAYKIAIQAASAAAIAALPPGFSLPINEPVLYGPDKLINQTMDKRRLALRLAELPGEQMQVVMDLIEMHQPTLFEGNSPLDPSTELTLDLGALTTQCISAIRKHLDRQVFKSSRPHHSSPAVTLRF